MTLEQLKKALVNCDEGIAASERQIDIAREIFKGAQRNLKFFKDGRLLIERKIADIITNGGA